MMQYNKGRFPLPEKRETVQKVAADMDSREMVDKKVSVDPPSKKDLDEYRKELGVFDKHTVAIGKTDVPGLEGLTFKGASIAVRRDAKLKALDEVAPDRLIKSPSPHPLGKAHAEEGVISEFVDAVNAAGLKPEQVSGTLYIHQSNPAGICSTCIQGLGKRKDGREVPPGVFLQLSKKYPNLRIKATSETVEGVKVNGKLSFELKNGELIE